MTDFVLRGGTLVFPDRDPAPQDVLVQDGKISAVLAPGAAAPAGIPQQSAAGLHILGSVTPCWPWYLPPRSR